MGHIGRFVLLSLAENNGSAVMNDRTAHLIKPLAKLADELIECVFRLFDELLHTEATGNFAGTTKLWHLVVPMRIAEALICGGRLKHQVPVCFPFRPKQILRRECEASQKRQFVIVP
jgi:hypothetical protein